MLKDNVELIGKINFLHSFLGDKSIKKICDKDLALPTLNPVVDFGLSLCGSPGGPGPSGLNT